MWEGVGDRTELQHIDPHSYGHNSVSFPFSWSAQPRAWGLSLSGYWFSLPHLISNCNCSIGGLRAHSAGCCLFIPHVVSSWSDLQLQLLNRGPEGPLLGAGFLYRIWFPTDWTSCALSYIIVQRPPSSCGRHKLHSFNPSTVKVIFWYSSTGRTCYLHCCISYFDNPAGSEVNIQQFLIELK